MPDAIYGDQRLDMLVQRTAGAKAQRLTQLIQARRMLKALQFSRR